MNFDIYQSENKSNRPNNAYMIYYKLFDHNLTPLLCFDKRFIIFYHIFEILHCENSNRINIFKLGVKSNNFVLNLPHFPRCLPGKII